MARPVKKGLDYFPFNIGFFDDVRMGYVSRSFGVKGDITAVKLLCAVYRNGYFILWDDDSRDQLLGQLPGISESLLGQIVRSLVRWGLFDKGLFDSESVLTSAEIQTTYFTAVRRRAWIKGRKLPYLLIDPEGVFADNNPVIVDNNPVIDGKKYIKEKIIINYPIYTHTLNAREAVAEIGGNASLTEGYCMTYHLDRAEFSRYLDEFANYAELSMKEYGSLSDAASHFQLWLIRRLKEKKEHGDTGRRTSADFVNESKKAGIEEALRFIREAEAAGR